MQIHLKNRTLFLKKDAKKIKSRNSAPLAGRNVARLRRWHLVLRALRRIGDEVERLHGIYRWMLWGDEVI